MMQQWKIAALGAAGGATIAIAVVFAAAALGLLPRGAAQDAQIHAYLMAHPTLVVDMMTKVQQQQEADADRAQKDALARVGQKAFFDPRIAFVTGPANARTSLVEFFDYNCPYCRASIPEVKRFYDAHRNDTRFSFIEFPIKGPDSIIAARAALAARRQPDKYVAFHFMLMNEEGMASEDTIYADAAKVGLDVAKLKADMASPAVDQAIALTQKLARDLKIDGTPTFVVNGTIRPGLVRKDELSDLLKGKAT
ncbi:MAG TPA: DsbA family protein [Rhizomicrobium sp.]|nr:DsbA family protein [Rhizomicrobium sp.]